MSLNERSLTRLQGVDPQLVALMQRAAAMSHLPIQITEGMRDRDRQAKLVAEGKSQTMNSRHLTGHAVDFHVLNDDGTANWDFPRYQEVYERAILPAAQELGVNIEWGGNWKTLKDGPHIQLAEASMTQDDNQQSAARNPQPTTIEAFQQEYRRRFGKEPPKTRATGRDLEPWRKEYERRFGAPAPQDQPPETPGIAPNETLGAIKGVLESGFVRDLIGEEAAGKIASYVPTHMEMVGILPVFGGEQTAAAAQAFEAGAQLEMADELDAIGRTGLQMLTHPLTGEAPDYHANLEAERRDRRAGAERFPQTDAAGKITGALTSGLAAPVAAARTATTLPGAMVRASGAGAGVGALQGAAAGEGHVDRGAQGVIGAGVGAVTGALAAPVVQAIAWVGARMGGAVQKILQRPGTVSDTGLTDAGRKALVEAGINPDDVSAEFQRAFMERSKSLPPDQAARGAALDEMNIPGTRGQVSGDVAQQATEEALRAGRSPSGARVMREFDASQADAVRAQSNRIGDGLGPATRPDGRDAAGMALEGVQRRASSAKAQSQRFYRASEEAGIQIKPEAFRGLVAQIEDRLAAEEIIVDSGTPVARRMMQMLQARSAPAKGDTIGGVSLELVDKTRSRIGEAYRNARRAGNTLEVEALGKIRESLDEWLDGAVDDALMSGSPEGLGVLKAARAAWSNYRKVFGGRAGADRMIGKMAEDEATPEDVANWLYGASKLGAKQSSIPLATRLKGILGENSAEWNAIRQGAWHRLTTRALQNGEVSPARMANDILQFLDGDRQKGLAKILFTPGEQRNMRAFTRALKALKPESRAVNPSGSGYVVDRIMGEMVKAASALFGGAAAGPNGAVAGYATGSALQGARGWLAAKAATAGIPTTRPPSVLPVVTGTGQAVQVQAQ